MKRSLFIPMILLAVGLSPTAQQPKSSGRYQLVENWGVASAGEPFYSVSAVATDPKGIVHAFRRDANNVWTLDASGRLLKTWGQGIAKGAHGIRVDRDGFIWTVDRNGHTLRARGGAPGSFG